MVWVTQTQTQRSCPSNLLAAGDIVCILSWTVQYVPGLTGDSIPHICKHIANNFHYIEMPKCDASHHGVCSAHNAPADLEMS